MKIGKPRKYWGMLKLKKLCMCVSLAKNMFGLNFHTEDIIIKEDKENTT